MVNYETTARGTLFGAGSPRHLVDYYARRRGPLTSNIAELSGFFRTGSHELPDMQIIGAPGFFFDNGFVTHDRPAFTFALSMIAPISEGSVGCARATPPTRSP